MNPQWADLLLSPIINTTISKLISTAAEQISLAIGWKKELETLQGKLLMIKDLLLDAEERQVRDRAVKRWLEKLRDVVREADDVLDEVSYESVKCKVENQNQKIMKKVCTKLFHRKIAEKIKNIIASVDDINNEASEFGLQIRLATASRVVSEHRRIPQTHSTIGDLSGVVGREDDISKIVHLLTDSSDESRLCVFSIVGMPGLGKTTLAQAVCNDEQIKNYFGKVMWVCVSDDFDVERILTEMLETLTKNSGGVKNKDTLIQKIREAMGEDNFLLILDDMWDEQSHGKFEDLRSCLLGICKNSRNRVIVTTRDEKVALKMRMHREHMHHLGKLQDAQCWSIIKERVFEDASVPSELEKVGWDIAQLCGGVPLVASVIGGTLCTERSHRVEWLSFKCKIEALGTLEHDDGNGIMPIIKLSFDRLPKSALKQCFAFCSIFPKDFVMKREMLIQLWMTKGFLQSDQESQMTMEDIGNKYFNDLLSYSLFQGEQRDSFGNIISCKMHDLIHDCAQLISKSETVIWKSLCTSNISNVRNLNLINGKGTLPAKFQDVAPKLHTLFLKDGSFNGMQVDLKNLRVLSFVDAANTEELSPCFGNMKRLRYLDISGTQIAELPKFITKLYNLQTFRFMTCRSLKMPPQGIGSLINLRHIYFSDEEQMPANIGRLTCLQTLPKFFVGTIKGRKIEELGNLRGLRGSLMIQNLELVKDKSEAMRAKLHEKTISELALRWGKKGNCDEDVLEGLQPHSDLQLLEISGYGGKNLPSWMLKNVLNCDLFLLENLVELRIVKSKKLESIPVMTGFSSLRRIRISGCDELSTIANGAFATLVSLKQLDIFSCPKLEGVLLNGLSLLQRLSIQYCTELNSIGDDLSTSTCLKYLSLWGCKNLRSIPSVFGLSSLEQLSFYDCGLEHLPTGLSSCIALKRLWISKCHCLISIPEDLTEIHSMVDLQLESCSKLRNIPKNTLDSLTSLKKLGIGGFSKELEEFPALSSIHSLQLEELKLIGWGKLTELPHQIQNLNLIALKSLSIVDFKEVETLPKWLANLSSLKSLSIWRCLRLKYLPSGLSFTTLEQLSIGKCPNLVSTNLEEMLSGLTHLKKLMIGSFSEELEEFPGLSSIHHLGTSLEELYLYGWEKLSQLPHQIQHPTALRRLFIYGFHGVEVLPEWLGNLSSLELLSINECKNLKHLPSAKAIRRLSKLKCLQILDCPELKIKCAKESGPEWYKISYIPTIFIDGEYR